MNLLDALNLLLALLQSGEQIAAAAKQVSDIIKVAHDEGRDHLTDNEIAQLRALDDAARAELVKRLGEP